MIENFELGLRLREKYPYRCLIVEMVRRALRDNDIQVLGTLPWVDSLVWPNQQGSNLFQTPEEKAAGRHIDDSSVLAGYLREMSST